MNLPKVPVSPNSVRTLDKAWEESPEWNQLADKTKIEWSRYRGRIVAAWGNLEVRGIEPMHVKALRDNWKDTPASANNMLRCLSSMLSWSVTSGFRTDNPAALIPLLKGGEGYAPWPWEIIQAARCELLEAGREDLWWAIALALYTGQRQDDCLHMRWSAISRGVIAVKQGKTQKELLIPIHRDLQAVLDTIPKRATTILTSSEGRPWASGFNASWRKNRPMLVRSNHLVFHGLRKSAVVFLLESGCTEAETASVTGQTLAMVAHYGKQVNQHRLAAAAILKWEEREQNRN